MTVEETAFPSDGEAIRDVPRLTLVIGDPEAEWNGGQVPEQDGKWMRERGRSPVFVPDR